jgi:ABC-2 type transport system ATP-binding protein
MITITNVSKCYDKKKKAVDNLSLEIKAGEIFGFIGHNGAGKTTTIKMMTGINTIDDGEILIDGVNIAANPIETKMKIGFVPDSPDMFLKLKGIEYLKFMGSVYGVSGSVLSNKITDLAHRFEMEHSLKDKIESYSHGMRQKIILIGALLHSPEVFILDEPMTGLDPRAAFTLKEIMREEADKGKTVFFSTHVLEVAEKLCDRIAMINKGKIIFCGHLAELTAQYEGLTLEEVFMEVTANA